MPQPPWPADAIEVGRIGEPWGVKGWFHVHPHAAPAEALRAAPVWHIETSAAAAQSAGRRTLTIRAVRAHADRLVASADGVDDRDAAQALQGAGIHVGRSAFPPAGDDEFYWADLIGLAVVNRAGESLGVVAGLIDNGPQAVLRACSHGDGGDGAEVVERLIPFVSAHVDSVDLVARRIVVDWQLDY